MLAVSTAYVIPEGRQKSTEKLVMEGHACNILKAPFAIWYKAMTSTMAFMHIQDNLSLHLITNSSDRSTQQSRACA